MVSFDNDKAVKMRTDEKVHRAAQRGEKDLAVITNDRSSVILVSFKLHVAKNEWNETQGISTKSEDGQRCGTPRIPISV